ncbi:MAG: tripartite tricarboxylate transporter TctB family protein [Pseudomonadota bacterium]
MAETEQGRELATRRKAGADLIAGIVILLISVYVLITSIGMPYYGDAGAVSSPGFTPGLISIFMIVMSVALIIRSRKFALPRGEWTAESGRVLTCLGIIVAYVLLMPIAGYAVATFLMLAAFQLAFSKRRSLRYLIIWVVGLSAVLTAGLWYLFGQIFLIPLP